MKAVGIVAEYNPFHSGHRYQIRKIREIFGAETPVAAVMSGDFVQRGEAASYDKFTRAEAAVRGGVSLVIELPLPWSLSSAESFARGGVGLRRSGRYRRTLLRQRERRSLRARKDGGGARHAGICRSAEARTHRRNAVCCGARTGGACSSWRDAAVLDTPNDLLAVEYIAAAAKLGYTFDYTPVRREGSTHDGAGRVRAPRASSRGGEPCRACPPGRWEVLRRADEAGRGFVSPGECWERRISPGCGRKRRRTLPPCRTRRRGCIFGFTKLRAAEAPRKRSPILPNQSGTPTRGCAAW